MVDHEKGIAATTTHHGEYSDDGPPPAVIDSAGDVQLPAGWLYRSRRLFGLRLPWYASPETQVLLVSFVCFLCPGMFNALNGLGGGGLYNQKAGDDSNTAVYSCFAVVGFFAGTITNRLGIRWTLALGGIGYSVYVSSYLCFKYTTNYGYVIFAGALLGVCAGMLWSAQGAIMLSYPPEGKKGRYIALFWIIFNLGAVIGALVPLSQNVHNNTSGSVNNGTYIGFLVLTFCGALIALTLVNGDKVIRRDGSKVILMKHPTWKSEFVGLFETFKTDPYIIFLFPMFLSSNWFYAYQFNNFNGDNFDVRARSLNNVLYWSAQIIGAAIFGFVLDISWMSRSNRARGAWVALMLLTMAIWGGGYAFEKTHHVTETTSSTVTIDWADKGYVGDAFLYIFYGMYDAIWQTCVYWYMGAISNNGRKLANFVGFYKGIQSAGGAITWALESHNTPTTSMFGSTWGLLAGSLVVALPVIILKIDDTTSLDKDLSFSDETRDDILAHKVVEEHESERGTTIHDAKI